MINKIALILAIFLASCSNMQQNATIEQSITLSEFIKSEDHELIDTLNSVALPAYIANERRITPDSATSLQKLLDELKKNGTEDIDKCFIPRHSVNFYTNDKIEKFVLVCFECDGVRFSNEKATPVKDVDKRIAQMKELKKYFAIN